MKINATCRLLSVRVVPQEDAYSDKNGASMLSKLRVILRNRNFVKHAATNDKNVSLAVYESPGKLVYMIGIQVGDRLVGAVTVTRVNREGKAGVLPSSYLLPKYRGRGLALMVYRWLLNSGFTLISGTHQSPFSHGLWKRLAREYKLSAVNDGRWVKGPDALAKIDDPEYTLVLSK